LVLCVLLCLISFNTTQAQHFRIFACAIANDSAGAFMGASSNGSGLYQSDDTGKTWKHLGWDNIKCYSMDMVQSSNGRILYEATGLGVLRSTDYGEHWKLLTDCRISEVMDIAVNQKNPNEIWIATAHGPWRTEDEGKHWALLVDGLQNRICSRVVVDSVLENHVLLASQDGLLSNSHRLWSAVTGSKSSVTSLLQTNGQFWLAASELQGGLASNDSGYSFFQLKRLISGPYWSVAEGKGLIDSVFFGNFALSLWGGKYGFGFAQTLGDETSWGWSDQLKNVSALFILPNYSNERFKGVIGTLGEGIFLTMAAGMGVNTNVLPKLQVWTLKSFLVTP
jgi:photosystem II stability/assembly factor-like uncharacterized protein